MGETCGDTAVLTQLAPMPRYHACLAWWEFSTVWYRPGLRRGGGPSAVRRVELVNSVRVALAQIAPKLGDPEANLDLHLATAKAARREKARLVVFPELSLTGYVLRDQVPDVALGRRSKTMTALLRASREIDLLVGFVEETERHTFRNAAAYLSRGRIVHVH